MTIVELLVYLFVAGVCGSLGQAITGYSRGGCLVAIALGFIGALLGTKLAEVLKLPEILNITIGNKSFPVAWSIIGSALFVAVLNFLSPKRRIG